MGSSIIERQSKRITGKQQSGDHFLRNYVAAPLPTVVIANDFNKKKVIFISFSVGQWSTNSIPLIQLNLSCSEWKLLQQTTASVDNSSFSGNKYHTTLKAGPVFGCAQRMMKFPFLKLYQHNTGRRPCNSMNTKSKRYLILTTGILLVKSAYGPSGPIRPELIPNSVGEASKSISIGMLVHRRGTAR